MEIRLQHHAFVQHAVWQLLPFFAVERLKADLIWLVSFPTRHRHHHLGIEQNHWMSPNDWALLRPIDQPIHHWQFVGSWPAIHFEHRLSPLFLPRQFDPRPDQSPRNGVRPELVVEQGVELMHPSFDPRFGSRNRKERHRQCLLPHRWPAYHASLERLVN